LIPTEASAFVKQQIEIEVVEIIGLELAATARLTLGSLKVEVRVEETRTCVDLFFHETLLIDAVTGARLVALNGPVHVVDGAERSYNNLNIVANNSNSDLNLAINVGTLSMAPMPGTDAMIAELMSLIPVLLKSFPASPPVPNAPDPQSNIAIQFQHLSVALATNTNADFEKKLLLYFDAGSIRIVNEKDIVIDTRLSARFSHLNHVFIQPFRVLLNYQLFPSESLEKISLQLDEPVKMKLETDFAREIVAAVKVWTKPLENVVMSALTLVPETPTIETAEKKQKTLELSLVAKRFLLKASTASLEDPEFTLQVDAFNFQYRTEKLESRGSDIMLEEKMKLLIDDVILYFGSSTILTAKEKKRGSIEEANTKQYALDFAMMTDQSQHAVVTVSLAREMLLLVDRIALATLLNLMTQFLPQLTALMTNMKPLINLETGVKDVIDGTALASSKDSASQQSTITMSRVALRLAGEYDIILAGVNLVMDAKDGSKEQLINVNLFDLQIASVDEVEALSFSHYILSKEQSVTGDLTRLKVNVNDESNAVQVDFELQPTIIRLSQADGTKVAHYLQVFAMAMKAHVQSLILEATRLANCFSEESFEVSSVKNVTPPLVKVNAVVGVQRLIVPLVSANELLSHPVAEECIVVEIGEIDLKTIQVKDSAALQYEICVNKIDLLTKQRVENSIPSSVASTSSSSTQQSPLAEFKLIKNLERLKLIVQTETVTLSESGEKKETSQEYDLLAKPSQLQRLFVQLHVGVVAFEMDFRNFEFLILVVNSQVQADALAPRIDDGFQRYLAHYKEALPSSQAIASKPAKLPMQQEVAIDLTVMKLEFTVRDEKKKENVIIQILSDDWYLNLLMLNKNTLQKCEFHVRSFCVLSGLDEQTNTPYKLIYLEKGRPNEASAEQLNEEDSISGSFNTVTKALAIRIDDVCVIPRKATLDIAMHLQAKIAKMNSDLMALASAFPNEKKPGLPEDSPAKTTTTTTESSSSNNPLVRANCEASIASAQLANESEVAVVVEVLLNRLAVRLLFANDEADDYLSLQLKGLALSASILASDDLKKLDFVVREVEMGLQVAKAGQERLNGIVGHYIETVPREAKENVRLSYVINYFGPPSLAVEQSGPQNELAVDVSLPQLLIAPHVLDRIFNFTLPFITSITQEAQNAQAQAQASKEEEKSLLPFEKYFWLRVNVAVPEVFVCSPVVGDAVVCFFIGMDKMSLNIVQENEVTKIKPSILNAFMKLTKVKRNVQPADSSILSPAWSNAANGLKWKLKFRPENSQFLTNLNLIFSMNNLISGTSEKEAASTPSNTIDLIVGMFESSLTFKKIYRLTTLIKIYQQTVSPFLLVLASEDAAVSDVSATPLLFLDQGALTSRASSHIGGQEGKSPPNLNAQSGNQPTPEVPVQPRPKLTTRRGVMTINEEEKNELRQKLNLQASGDYVCCCELILVEF
jgi:hypothetical protein